MTTIRAATPADFNELAHFIAAQCAVPATQCLQASAGESVPSLTTELAQLHDSGEMVFVVARRQGVLLGAMGCEFEKEGRRGWLRGPLVGKTERALMPELYTALRAALPDDVRRLDTFLHAANQRGRAFYTDHGFTPGQVSHVYEAPRPDAPLPAAGADIRPLTAADHDTFATLHDACFPETFYSGRQIIVQLDDDHRVWVAGPAGAVRGYVFAAVEPWAEDGYVEFLGVDPAARRQGLGGALLRRALQWCFDRPAVKIVGLTVNDDNVNARGLYESVGFRLVYTGVNQRLEW